MNATPAVATTAVPEPPAGYVLRVGDEIDIRLFYHPDMNTSMSIRPDGRVSFPLLGDLDAAGLTPEQLSKGISSGLGAELKNSQTTIIVKKFSELRFYVGGEVVNSGIFQLAQPMTALQAIVQAGGLKVTAQPKEIIIVRAVDKNTPKLIRVSLDQDTILSLDAANNIPIQPLDMIYVPKSKIARINDFVEYYIKRLNPATLVFGLNYNLGAFTFRQ